MEKRFIRKIGTIIKNFNPHTILDMTDYLDNLYQDLQDILYSSVIVLIDNIGI